MMNLTANDEVTGVFVTDVRGTLVRDCSDDETIEVKIETNTPCGTEMIYDFKPFAADDKTSELNDTLVVRLLQAVRKL